MIDVLIVVPPRSLLLDVAGPAEAFRLANQQLERQSGPARFRLRFAGPLPEATTSVGLPLAQLEPLPTTLKQPTWLLLVGQSSDTLRTPDAASRATIAWLQRHMRPQLTAPDTPHRLLTVCAGTLMAARAGLLDRQRCTTHHDYLDMLRTLAPAAEVVENRVFVVEGRVASSAGVTAGIDLALHLIADECGDPVASAVAKTMVVYLRRTPQDPELSPLLAHRHHLHPALHRAQDAVCERPEAEWTLESLADAAHVTSRHLLRLFAEHAMVSPMVYVEKIRLERARQALQRGASVTRAAEAAGFSSDLQLRRAWGRHFSGTPRSARASH
ncbi:GlxA family transcriptional regulator [Piscinibacter sp. HJYY11]|uniref:GlxA family transcriptional regulator n=1 Tax=Piscinibacter sp. HJYY11 TaxID=2801333 RepID=UPI00191CF510|nr:helix-turn-helix domain-containing protein [Piscinibacter sp. HJYY11]MBL0728354.1 helix-turn-helix domain-containing protein [Piscinibacter sp. HJYY11]